MSEKERLNLTVRDNFKEKAAKLAEQRRRSVSGLFEDLIEREWSRVHEDDPDAKTVPMPSQRRKVIYPKNRKRGKKAA